MRLSDLKPGDNFRFVNKPEVGLNWSGAYTLIGSHFQLHPYYKYFYIDSNFRVCGTENDFEVQPYSVKKVAIKRLNFKQT